MSEKGVISLKHLWGKVPPKLVYGLLEKELLEFSGMDIISLSNYEFNWLLLVILCTGKGAPGVK